MGSLLGGKGGKQSQGSEGSGSSTSSSSSSTTPGFTNELNEVLQRTLSGNTGFSKADAVADVQGLLRQQATDALQQVMPSIAKQSISAGAYNSSTKQLLQNDAEARITGQLASTLTDTIAKYKGIEQGDINAFSNATKAATSSQSSSTSDSEYSQSAWGNSKSGGSGLLGLFEDGGEVPEQEEEQSSGVNKALQQFMKTSGISSIVDSVSTVKDNITDPSKSVGDVAKSFMSEQDRKEMQGVMDIADLVTSFFADGGKVPEGSDSLSNKFRNNIFQETRNRRAREAGLPEEETSGGGITINVNTGSNGGEKSQTTQEPQANNPMMALIQSLRERVGFEDGGKVPDHMKLIEAIRHHADGGKVRSGESDVQAGGKIRGPESKTGKDNQVIGVAGGEGILAKDVMDVPGVPQLVEYLNNQFHTPSK